MSYDIIMTLISTCAVIVMAFFAWQMWKIASLQHKMYHDPDLSCFCYPSAGTQNYIQHFKEGNSISYEIILVNPGRMPIVITDIREKVFVEEFKKEVDIVMNYEPSKCLQNISKLPWVIESDNFARYCRKANTWDNQHLREKRFRPKVKLEYFVGEKRKEKEIIPSLHVGFESAVPLRV